MVFAAGEEAGFLIGDVVVVFRTPVTVVLLTFETVDVRLATEWVVFTAVVVLVVAVAVVVLGAAAPTVLNLLVIAFELGLLGTVVVVVVVVVDEAVLLPVDGTVRGLAVGTVDEVRVVAVVLDFAGADAVDFVVAVDGFAAVDLTDALEGLALVALPLLVAELLAVVDLRVLVGFLAAGAAFTSPLTAVVAGFLIVNGAFFSVAGLVVALPTVLERPTVDDEGGLAALVVLVDGALLTVVAFLIVLVGAGFVVVDGLVVAGFALSFAAVVVFFSTVGAAGFVVFAVVVLDVVGLAVVEVLVVGLVVAVFVSATTDFNSSTTGWASGIADTCSRTGVTVSNRLGVVDFSTNSATGSTTKLSVVSVAIGSLIGSSNTGSDSVGASAENMDLEGDCTFNTLSSVMNSFSATTSCSKDSTNGETSSSVSAA